MSLQDCITKKVKILHDEDPNRPNNQNVAIAYQHCRTNFAGDSLTGQDGIRITNQVLATEGVLKYGDKRMLKQWGDLKNFDGKIVPIVDEHPDKNNGFDGRVSGKEKVYGIGRIHQCVKGEPVICFDSDLSNDAPIKNGYSIGFVYNEEDSKGNYYGEDYDGIQHITEIDHIALTSFPRNPIALASIPATDSLQKDGDPSNNHVVKYSFGYDSFNTFKLLKTDAETSSSDTLAEGKPMPDKEENASKTEEGTEEEMDEEEEKEVKKDSKKKSKDSTAKDSKVESDSRFVKLKAERDQFAADSKRYKELYETSVSSQIKVEIDSLHSEYGIDAKEFDGKSRDFVAGAMFLHNHIQSQPQSSVEGSHDVATGDSVAVDSINNYRWNASAGKMEKVSK
jgi:hypothetical protein